MKIYIVGIRDAEQNTISHIHMSYDGALKSFQKVRLELLEDVKRICFYEMETLRNSNLSQKEIENLMCEDPKTIDNYPLDTPYIEEFELEE